MSLPVLERLLMPFLKSGEIFRALIFAGMSTGCHCACSIWKQREINGETNKELFDFLMHYHVKCE